VGLTRPPPCPAQHPRRLRSGAQGGRVGRGPANGHHTQAEGSRVGEATRTWSPERLMKTRMYPRARSAASSTTADLGVGGVVAGADLVPDSGLPPGPVIGQRRVRRRWWAGGPLRVRRTTRPHRPCRYRERHIQGGLARIMHRPRLAPRCQRRRYRLIQTGLADRLHKQHSAGLGDHSAPTAFGTDTRVGPDTLLHLESATSMRRPGPWTRPIVAGQEHSPRFDHPPYALPRESARLTSIVHESSSVR
jgi:hypothetical protein